jgi:hypothetical protein
MEKFVNQPLKPRSFFTVPLSVLLATFATALGAQSVEAAKPMALRTIMERLGRDMQAVTGAISKEDWPLVAELAPRIAKHAEPPMSEKMRILAGLGQTLESFGVLMDRSMTPRPPWARLHSGMTAKQSSRLSPKPSKAA